MDWWIITWVIAIQSGLTACFGLIGIEKDGPVGSFIISIFVFICSCLALLFLYGVRIGAAQ